MPVILNFSARSTLPENELEALRYIVRHNQNDVAITTNQRQMAIRYVESVNGFSVTPIHRDSFSRLINRDNHLARNLENQINNGRSFQQVTRDFMFQMSSNIGWQRGHRDALMNAIHSHSFNVNTDEFSCDKQFLECPITLCIPKQGIFVKNALNSNICTLYDKSAFINLTREHLPHPLSREKIVKEMIIERNMCYFDTISQHFIIMDADQQKQYCK
ncbi:DUF1076 domain-containing protein [Escherichia coli]